MNLYDNKDLDFLSTAPITKPEFIEWLNQKDVISYLSQEIEDNDIILFMTIPDCFINSVLIPNIEGSKDNIDDLLKWNFSIDSSWGVSISQSEVTVEPPLSNTGSNIINSGEQLIYYRSKEWGKKSYYEFNQKILHLLDLHFVDEKNSWCRLDKFGEIMEVIKIIKYKKDSEEMGTILTINKEILCEYTCIENWDLLRLLDFARYQKGDFKGWSNNKRTSLNFSDDIGIFGNLTLDGINGSYSRGVQIAKFEKLKNEIKQREWSLSANYEEKEYMTFITYDWKNKIVNEISCNPKYLGNYFIESNLPFEISPVFFRIEVLLKYKSDRSKYQLSERSIGCRGSWYLKTFDINKANQVHTYIKYLGDLPYEEQLHWKQYNEKPKTPISERAYCTDFEGKYYEEYDPLPSLKYSLEKLSNSNIDWWTLRDSEAPNKVHYPYTTSPDEWADEILYLDQLLIEGFEEKLLRFKAKELGRDPDDRFRSLKLIEECLIGFGFEIDHASKIMSPFREIHNLRSKLKGHAWGSEAEKERKKILKEFGSFRKHFERLCTECDESIKIIQKAFSIQ